MLQKKSCAPYSCVYIIRRRFVRYLYIMYVQLAKMNENFSQGDTLGHRHDLNIRRLWQEYEVN